MKLASALPLLVLLRHSASATAPSEGPSPPSGVDFTVDMSTSRARRFGEDTLQFGTRSVGYRCAAIPIDRALGLDPGAAIPPAQITGFGPRFEDGTGAEDIVHHMDVFACKGEPKDYTGMSGCSDPFNLPECGPFVTVYDKGAGDYHFPDDVGVAVGEGTGATWFLIQTHYLMEKEPQDLTTLTSIGNSGFKMWFQVGGAQRPHNARFAGIMDETLQVPETTQEYAYKVPETSLQPFLQHDLDTFGNLTVFAGHLHAHDHCSGFYMYLRRRDERQEWAQWDQFSSIAPYGGYGANQTMQDFGPASNTGERIELRGGEELRIRCTWRNPHPYLGYGTDNGEEMCGPILMYYPTDHTKSQKSIVYTGPHRELGSWRRSAGVIEGATERTQFLRRPLYKQTSA